MPSLGRAEDLIAEIEQLGITVWAEDRRLRYKAPQGILTPELKQRLTDNRDRLLALLSGRDGSWHETRLPPVTTRPPDQERQLSYSQQRLWFLDQLLPGQPTYNMAYAYRLRGPLDVEALRQALCDIVRRHEVLRTGIVAVDGVAHPRVATDIAVELPVNDLSGCAESEREAQARRLASSEVRRPFDLSSAPLLRALLLRLDSAEYWLVLCLHHVVNDDRSFDILWHELETGYQARCRGSAAELPDLPIQYADFTAWQRAQLNAGRLDAQQDYWRRQLGWERPTLDLPTDRKRPASKAYRGDLCTFLVPGDIADALRHLAQSCNATLDMVVAAALMALLCRYTGQDDIVIGTTIAGRRQQEVESLIGLFINTVVLRTDLSGDPSFRQLIDRVRNVALAAYAHQDIPFERVIEELRPARDPSRSPLFDVLLVLHKAPVPRRLSGLQIEQLPVTTGTARFDMTLELTEASGSQLNGSFEYDVDLFEPATIDRLVTHFLTLLAGAASASDRRLSELPLLTDAERRRLQVEWNATASDYPREKCLHELFEEQVARAPGRTALKVGTTVVSYAELEARSTRLAHVLRLRGVGRGERVGLCVERNAEMLAPVLGILKAGAAYVPLEPSFPEERLRFIAQDAEFALLVSTTALASGFGLPRERQLLLDADAGSIAAAPDTRLPVDADSARAEDPAYVIYTSGSTGKPKGVVVPHRAVVNFLTSMAREPGLTADDVLVAVTTLSCDISVPELQLPLAVGATVVIASRDEAMDDHALMRLLERHRATVMHATPATWRLLLEAGWTGGRPFKALVGVEPLPQDIADQLIMRGVELWNMYGSIETAVWSTCARITEISNGITIGKPIANTSVRILDAQKNLCPIGVPGELCIGGDGVALGYWNRPELTAERFIPDPFSSTPEATLYRTGDRARWRSDGTLEHLGRLDDQVIVRGFRVELGEIEAVLAEHPAVGQAAVHLWKVQANDVRIVACCVPANAGTLAPVSLRKHLRARLPEYMIPQYFLPVEEIPLTPNGKIDRNKLPVPAVTESRIGQHEAPSDPVERAIAEIWTNLIGPARSIGRTDKFFEMGGHSLLALQALRQMENKLGVRLEFRVLFQESLADIAIRCRSDPIATGLGQSGTAIPLVFALE
jgi:surfactin family lipopeptide synthetase A